MFIKEGSNRLCAQGCSLVHHCFQGVPGGISSEDGVVRKQLMVYSEPIFKEVYTFQLEVFYEKSRKRNRDILDVIHIGNAGI